ncbi:6-phosphogluconate dehydrogenase C-terminal domain-like protein [Myriangium duriaei CBS 260.36]|uniref:6-phosphogluconate dehydrogenase, decarboxylating n=1 Tax=Myriangium duriaei CBS 260.36 TaxID=1168546 RepID=A0A9P4IXE9_9PEZI|nr:6-phosphogluconate dehydrogenase C-terminal domain-like protein [Myriangium duriaei CBS 260.36]
MGIEKLAMIGCGSMGGGMALLFAEKGLQISLQDPSEDAMKGIKSQAEKDGVGDRVSIYKDYKSLCGSLGSPKVFVFSLPHGSVGDTVFDGLLPYLDKGDIIIDAGNEHWMNTERRQGKAVLRGIRYVGMGVSGGYQAARRGPSMCPGGDDESLDIVLPLLQKAAAKDPKGNACVGKAGLGGSGHYVKMLHNGIEHGMMSAVSEAWSIMVHGLDMSYDEVAETFKKWNSEGELRGTFLIDIGIRICTAKDPKTGEKVLRTVEDKVVQDVTGEEGTGIWSNTESVEEHIPAPTLSVAHFLRLASSDRHQRRRIQSAFGTSYPPQKLSVNDKSAFVEDLRQAVYAASLCAYVQGLNVINKTNSARKWHIDFSAVLQIWRAGCIIQADYIADLLAPILDNYQSKDLTNLLYEPAIAAELKRTKPALQRVVGQAVAGDHVVPAISASLEYVKYQTGLELPTQFYEAELDYFGKHMYDRTDEDKEEAPTEGKHHFEWKKA